MQVDQITGRRCEPSENEGNFHAVAGANDSHTATIERTGGPTTGRRIQRLQNLAKGDG